MKEKEIVKSNKLIAEFMGFSIVDMYNHGFTYINPTETKSEWKNSTQSWEDTNVFSTTFDPCWNDSWDWIMPVVKACTDKTNEFQYDDELYQHWEEEIFNIDNMLSEFLNNDIESIYNRIVEFIKYWNKNKTNL